MKISVIIPVYNTEPYLKKCLESVISQTYKDLEIIIIDDGSTDNSLLICKQFAQIDSRVLIYHQDNGGVSSARNKGLYYASGEWISFLDSDDYLDPDFYETLLSGATESSEIICCGVRPVNHNHLEVAHLQYEKIPKEAILLSGEELWTHFLHPSKRYIYWSPWDKLFQSSLAKKFQFLPDRKIAEDFYYCYQCLKESGKIYYIPDKKYNYLIREGSATHSKVFNKSAFDSLFISKCIFDDSNEENNLKYYARLNLLIVASRIVRNYYSQASMDKKYKMDIHYTRELIKNNWRKYCFKELKFKHIMLIKEAAFFPFLFKLK